MPASLRVVAIAALLALAGCSTGDVDDEAKGGTLTVYVSAPLSGHSGEEGRAVVNGAKLALADAGGEAGGLDVAAVYMDDTSGTGGGARWDPVVTADNARRAAQDSTAIAYVGELESGATRTSLPITNQAFMLQVSAGSTAVDLARESSASDDVPDLYQPTGERTFGRVIPDDEKQAGAGAVWAKRLGLATVALASDGKSFGDVVGAEFQEEAEALGIAVEERRAVECPGASPAYLASEAFGAPILPGGGDEPVIATDAFLEPFELQREVVAGCQPELHITSAAQDPEQLPPAGRRFARAYEREFGQPPNRYAAYGYEAMAVVLDSIERAADPRDRSAVIDAFFATADRDSVLGRYSIDEAGNTTLDAISGYRIQAGEPRFDVALRAP
jgi:branched-chain amino acid transport system substrate-binding protein